mgnify:FL=1|jgi:aromatic ring-opening dioxygenase catalytic subunit (LigB family)
MIRTAEADKGSVLYVSHGGGPLPLFGDPGHAKMIDFMRGLSGKIGKPDAILVFSAHWEESVPTILGTANPPLLYDYYGFPDEAYSLQYALPGNPELARRIHAMFSDAGIDSKIDTVRGFDHGVFVPLMLMQPEGTIPTIQISLIKGLDPARHIAMGKALKGLLQENILIIGSGFSFHNMRQFSRNAGSIADPKNDLFQDSLIEYCTKRTSAKDIEAGLAGWEHIPGARYCHPREEHVLPLHVCFGLAQKPGTLVFDDYILGKRAVAFSWD